MEELKIKEHLNEVFKEIESFLGFKPYCYIAGGSIASLILNEEVKDYDVWFENIRDFSEVDSNPNVANVATRSNFATTVFLPSGKKIQFIQSRLGKPQRVVPTFDFKHTHSYYTIDGVLSCDINFIKNKELIFAGRLDHPLNTLERVLKFQRRGYYVPSATLMDIMLKLKKTNRRTISRSANGNVGSV